MRLFVGNIPYNATDDQLKKMFEEVGKVESAQIVMDRMSGRSRGFGFVEMADADAKKAVEALNGKELEGRALVVNEARPRVERGDRAEAA
jgi:RNA recognition motif-containing protein